MATARSRRDDRAANRYLPPLPTVDAGESGAGGWDGGGKAFSVFAMALARSLVSAVALGIFWFIAPVEVAVLDEA